MTDLERAISLVESIISNINEQLGKIDKDSADFAEIEKRFEYKITLKNDRYIYQHALDLLKEHRDFKESMKQKKPYIAPTTEVTETKTEEPIACSYYDDHHSGKPGHGWGDRNHDHIGPPGQNKKNGITDIWEDL